MLRQLNAFSFCLAAALHAADVTTLFDVTADAKLPTFSLQNARVEKMGPADELGLAVHFGHKAPWPNIRFHAASVGYRTDWSAYTMVGVTLTNPMDKSVRVGFRVDSKASARMGRQGHAEIPAKAQRRLLMPISDAGAIIGMRGQPPLSTDGEGADIVLGHNNRALNASAITNFQLFMARPKTDYSIVLHRIELVRSGLAERTAFVDRFGQYNEADWPGKLHREAEFAERIKQELAYLRAYPALPDRNQYGGWQAGPQLEATGRFRVAKHEGKWWFVDPEGRLFWSSGLTCVGRRNAATRIAGREFCYSWLPQKDDPLAQFYRGRGKRRMYDFFQANLLRKYGQDFGERFRDVTIRRLLAWGVNTIANWSEAEMWETKRLPYVIPVHARGRPSFVAESFMMAGLEKKKWFPDPFDPRYEEKLGEALGRLEAQRDDPWLLGVFVDNELAWTVRPPWKRGKSIRISAAALIINGPESKMKRALVAALQRKYETTDRLNQAWGTDLETWEDALKPLELTQQHADRASRDFAELDLVIAREYFRKTRDAVRKWLPGALYLGPRFSGRYTPEVVRVAAEHCDVVSFNIYEYLPDMRRADELAAEHGFPVVIGEFHFGALDRGMFHTGLRKARDQADRAQKYVAYVRAAAKAPWCVGAHWFQYKDQALTGRADGENYNIGFVDATDDPYPEMVEAAREVHTGLYELRSRGE